MKVILGSESKNRPLEANQLTEVLRVMKVQLRFNRMKNITKGEPINISPVCLYNMAVAEMAVCREGAFAY